MSMVSIQKCAGVLISTVTYFSIAAVRFSLLIGSELKFSNCLPFFYPLLEYVFFLSSTALLIKELLIKKISVIWLRIHKYSLSDECASTELRVIEEHICLEKVHLCVAGWVIYFLVSSKVGYNMIFFAWKSLGWKNCHKPFDQSCVQIAISQKPTTHGWIRLLALFSFWVVNFLLGDGEQRFPSQKRR